MITDISIFVRISWIKSLFCPLSTDSITIVVEHGAFSILVFCDPYISLGYAYLSIAILVYGIFSRFEFVIRVHPLFAMRRTREGEGHVLSPWPIIAGYGIR